MNDVIIELTGKQIIHNSNIHIPKEKWYLFPEKDTIIELVCGKNSIQRKFNGGNHEFAIGEWFTLYKLKGGDKIIIKQIINKKKYDITILRSS